MSELASFQEKPSREDASSPRSGGKAPIQAPVPVQEMQQHPCQALESVVYPTLAKLLALSESVRSS